MSYTAEQIKGKQQSLAEVSKKASGEKRRLFLESGEIIEQLLRERDEAEKQVTRLAEECKNRDEAKSTALKAVRERIATQKLADSCPAFPCGEANCGACAWDNCVNVMLAIIDEEMNRV